MKALFDPRKTRGLILSGALVGALGSIVFMGFALRAQADAPEPDAAPLAPLDAAALLGMPVAGIRRADLIDGYFEKRGRRRIHNAIDIMAPRNTAVRAATSGTIAALNSSPAGGTSIWQYDTSGTFCYFYAHLARYVPGLRAGQTVRPRRRARLRRHDRQRAEAARRTCTSPSSGWRRRGRWWTGEPVNPYPLLRGDPLDSAALAAE